MAPAGKIRPFALMLGPSHRGGRRTDRVVARALARRDQRVATADAVEARQCDRVRTPAQ